jgi:hypothetical protein
LLTAWWRCAAIAIVAAVARCSRAAIDGTHSTGGGTSAEDDEDDDEDEEEEEDEEVPVGVESGDELAADAPDMRSGGSESPAKLALRHAHRLSNRTANGKCQISTHKSYCSLDD